MPNDILGYEISRDSEPPYDGICPKCDGEIKYDTAVGWTCRTCNEEFEDA